MMVDRDNDMGFVEVVKAIKKEIEKLETAGKKNEMFYLNDVEVELSVSVTKGGTGGINIGIVQLGGKIEKQNLHKVKLNLSVLPKIEKMKPRESLTNIANILAQKHLESIGIPYPLSEAYSKTPSKTKQTKRKV